MNNVNLIQQNDTIESIDIEDDLQNDDSVNSYLDSWNKILDT